MFHILLTLDTNNALNGNNSNKIISDKNWNCNFALKLDKTCLYNFALKLSKYWLLKIFLDWIEKYGLCLLMAFM